MVIANPENAIPVFEKWKWAWIQILAEDLVDGKAYEYQAWSRQG